MTPAFVDHDDWLPSYLIRPPLEAKFDLARIEGMASRYQFGITVTDDTDFGLWVWWRYVTDPGSNTAARPAAQQEN